MNASEHIRRAFRHTDAAFGEIDKAFVAARAVHTPQGNIQEITLRGDRWSLFKRLSGAAFRALLTGKTQICLKKI
jgi:hypothetical protein